MSGGAVVTILFTDLVGSSELHERLGDDHANRLLRRHFRVIREAISAAGGSEVKNLGDGLMVIFASAVDAVNAAIAIQLRVERETRGSDDRLEVRVGLHVGEPIRDEEDYFGSSVNIARRLCDAATAGQILTSRLLRDLVGSRGNLVFYDVGELQLKGVSAPVAACEVEWHVGEPVELPLPDELLTPIRSPFVGREAELEVVRKEWQLALDGRRRLVVVAGEPGTGKSRLVREFTAGAAASGATVMFGGCDQEGVVPYQPFAKAIRGYLGRCSPAQAGAILGAGSASLVHLLPELADRLPRADGHLLDDPEVQRYRLFQAITGFLDTVATDAPLALVLDDLHWADRPSLLVLRHVLLASTPAPLMVLATFRDIEVDRRHGLTQVLADIRREDGVARIDLGGLSRAEVASFLEHAALSDDGDDLAGPVHRETEGNPFFIEEIVQDLGAAGTTRAAAASDLAIPDSVREMVEQRLARLSPACHRLLDVASVLGGEFELRTLQGAAGMPMNEVLDTLAEADDARIVTEVPHQPGRFSFAHSLVRRTLYDDLGQARRINLHQRAAESIEGLYGDRLDEHLPQLAHHYLAAAPSGQLDKAVDYALAAGRRATAQLAFEEAISHFRSGLGLLETAGTDAVRRCQLLIGLGDALNRSGEPDQAHGLFLEAAGLARGLGSGALLADAALGFGGFASFGDPGVNAQLVVLLEEALAAQADDAYEFRVRILARLGVELYYERDPARRGAYAKAAVELAHEARQPALLAHAIRSSIIATWGPDTLQARLEGAGELVEMAGSIDDREAEVTARNYRAAALLELGQVEAAFEEIDRIEAVARSVDAPAARWQATSYRALQAILQGRFDEGERLATEALEVGQKVRSQAAMQAYAAQLYSIRWNQGRLEELEAVVMSMADPNSAVGGWQAALALFNMELGRLDPAREQLEATASENFASIAKDGAFLSAMGSLTTVCMAVGNAAIARQLHERLEPYVDRVVMLGWGALSQASVAYHVGMVSIVMGDFEAAGAYLDTATEMDRRMGATPWQARVHLARAHLHTRRHRAGDADAAARELAAATAIAEPLGMGYLLRDIEALRAG